MVKPAFDLQSLRELSVAQRLEILSAVWESLRDDAPDALMPITPELAAELDRRVAEHEADPDSALDWETVREEIRRGRFSADE